MAFHVTGVRNARGGSTLWRTKLTVWPHCPSLLLMSLNTTQHTQHSELVVVTHAKQWPHDDRSTIHWRLIWNVSVQLGWFQSQECSSFISWLLFQSSRAALHDVGLILGFPDYQRTCEKNPELRASVQSAVDRGSIGQSTVIWTDRK